MPAVANRTRPGIAKRRACVSVLVTVGTDGRNVFLCTCAPLQMSVEVPEASWSDVGGLADVKQRLTEAVQWAHTHTAALRRVGAKAPRGVLLYGATTTLDHQVVVNRAHGTRLVRRGAYSFSHGRDYAWIYVVERRGSRWEQVLVARRAK